MKDVVDVECVECADTPSYYQMAGGHDGYDVLDTVLGDNATYFYEGCVLKYMMRWREKNGVSDLRKARDYIDKILEVVDCE